MGLLLGGLQLGWIMCIENIVLVLEVLATGIVFHFPDIALDPASEIESA